MVFVVGVLVHGHQGLLQIIVIFRWQPFLTSNPGLQDIQRIEMQWCIGFFSQTEQPNIIDYRRPHLPLDLTDGKKIGWWNGQWFLLLVYWLMVLVNPTITIIRDYWISLLFSDDNLSWRAILVFNTFSTSIVSEASVSFLNSQILLIIVDLSFH